MPPVIAYALLLANPHWLMPPAARDFPKPAPGRVDTLVAQLDANAYADRKAAGKELAAYGWHAMPAL
jgi:hypothetical protein